MNALAKTGFDSERFRCSPMQEMQWTPGGTVRMGADGSYPEEAPVHTVTVSGFWKGAHAVTNAEFAAFVQAMGYRTVAERPLDPTLYPGDHPDLLKPGSAVFFMPTDKVDTRGTDSRRDSRSGPRLRRRTAPAQPTRPSDQVPSRQR
jgi:formylglycine-generating enzyme required for sulfatase activity